MALVKDEMKETIAAVATGGVLSAIGIVRVSGSETLRLMDEVFIPVGKKAMTEHPSRELVYGKLLDADNNVIDWCLCTVSRAPHSYTGEDTAELQCHGSPVVLQAALESLFSRGARQAKAGEFTRRAFLNGRMDLTQAEAVIDLIDAETPLAAQNAAGQLSGAISRRVDKVYNQLTDICSHYHAVLDYPDEEIPEFRIESYKDAVREGETSLKDLLDTFSRGKVLEMGVPTTICGKPNAGKSSLLNALLGYDRAIVTPIPGTTRDTLSEKCTIGHIPLRLTDTAGLHETGDEVEKLGVERAKKALESSELALVVFDTSRLWEEEDSEIASLAEKVPVKIAVLNKNDLEPMWNPSRLPIRFDAVCSLSAQNGDGVAELSAAIERMFPVPKANAGEILTNARQAESVARAVEYLHEAGTAMEDGLPPDIVLTECEGAMAALAELTGRAVHDDVTNKIFSRFCVGK